MQADQDYQKLANKVLAKLSGFIVRLVSDWMLDRKGEITNMPISPSPSMLGRQRVIFDSFGVEYTVDIIAKRKA